MSEHGKRRFEDAAAIDEVVRLQQRLALRWGRHAAESAERFQNGDFSAATWLDAHARFVARATGDWLSMVRALSKVGGAW